MYVQLDKRYGCFPDTEEVTGSIPVSPTTSYSESALLEATVLAQFRNIG